MKLLPYAAALIGTLLFPVGLHAQTVPVTDGDFEQPDVNTYLLGISLPIGGVAPYGNGASSSVIDGSWNVSTGDVSLVNQGELVGLLFSPLTNDSSQYVVLNASPLSLLGGQTTGEITQSLATTAGTTYQVNYQAGALFVGIATSNQGVFNAGVQGVTTQGSGGGTLLDVAVGGMTNESFTFTATGSTSVLDFSESNSVLADVGGVAIDNVSVTVVPEPSHTAAIFIGFGLLLVVVRRLFTENAFINRKKTKDDEQPGSSAPIGQS
jgi:hypothetical protein